ncbi:hypothetical protein OQC17_004604 [Salmonella enterica]|nr:hypothetical protein [Salmonella enterica]
MTPHKIFYDYRILSIAFYDSVITMLTSSAIDEYMIMKRYHVIGLAILAGFVAGLAVPAHADEVMYKSGSYQCGNTDMTAQIKIDKHTQLINGYITHKAIFSVVDFNGKPYQSGFEFLDVSGQWALTANSKYYAVFSGNTLVIGEYLKSNKTKELYYCTAD